MTFGRTKKILSLIETQRIGRLEDQGEIDFIETQRIGRLEDQGEFDAWRTKEN